jgi:hypothetical protein
VDPEVTANSASLERTPEEIIADVEARERLVEEFAAVIQRARGRPRGVFSPVDWWLLAAAVVPIFVLYAVKTTTQTVPPGLLSFCSLLSSVGMFAVMFRGVGYALRNALAFKDASEAGVRRFQLSLVVVLTVLVIGAFAVVYHLVSSVTVEHYVSGANARVNGWDAVYFSIATLTTTGYGDLAPHGLLRAVAASEMLAGYVLLGTFISALTSHLTASAAAPDIIFLLRDAFARAQIPQDQQQQVIEFVNSELRRNGEYGRFTLGELERPPS